MCSSSPQDLNTLIKSAADRGYVTLPDKAALATAGPLPANTLETKDALIRLLKQILS